MDGTHRSLPVVAVAPLARCPGTGESRHDLWALSAARHSHGFGVVPRVIRQGLMKTWSENWLSSNAIWNFNGISGATPNLLPSEAAIP